MCVLVAPRKLCTLARFVDSHKTGHVLVHGCVNRASIDEIVIRTARQLFGQLTCGVSTGMSPTIPREDNEGNFFLQRMTTRRGSSQPIASIIFILQHK